MKCSLEWLTFETLGGNFKPQVFTYTVEMIIYMINDPTRLKLVQTSLKAMPLIPSLSRKPKKLIDGNVKKNRKSCIEGVTCDKQDN